MITRGLTLWAIAVAVLAAACTLDQASVPPLTGPSGFATSLTLTTNPDTLVLNGQQSVVIVQAIGPSGGPLANLRVHLDLVSGTAVRLRSPFVDRRHDRQRWSRRRRLHRPDTAAALARVRQWSGRHHDCGDAGGHECAGGEQFQRRHPLPDAKPPRSPAAVFAVNFAISPNPAASEQTGDVQRRRQRVARARDPQLRLSMELERRHRRKSARASRTTSAPSEHYVVTLTITDDIGQSGSKSALLTVN